MALTANQKVQKSLEIVNIIDGSLNVDHSYQRRLSQKLVEEIAADWDLIASDELTVSQRRDGSLWIVNGQHEAAAAALKGETEMFAWIYTGLTPKREADLRLKKNNGKADTALERFKARVAKGDKAALDISAILQEFGTKVNEQANKHSGINCVSTLDSLHAEDREVFVRMLRALREAHGELAGDVVTVAPINAVYWFFRVHAGQYRWKRLIEVMAKTGTNELLQLARDHQRVAKGALWLNYYRAIIEKYNFKLRGKRLEVITKYSASIEYDPEDRWGGVESRRLS